MAKCSFITIFLLDLPDKSLCFGGCFKSLCAALVCNHQSSRNKDAVSYSHIAQLLSDTIKFSVFGGLLLPDLGRNVLDDPCREFLFWLWPLSTQQPYPCRSETS